MITLILTVAVMEGQWQWNTSKTNISPSLKPLGRRWKKFGKEHSGVADLVKCFFPLTTNAKTSPSILSYFKTDNWTTPIYASSLAVPLRSPMWASSQSTAPKEACLMSCWTTTYPSTGVLGRKTLQTASLWTCWVDLGVVFLTKPMLEMHFLQRSYQSQI